MTTEKKHMEERLQKLFAVYTKSLPDKIAALDPLWQSVNETWEPERISEFHRAVHTLYGSSATYGYIAFARHAHQLEVLLKLLSEMKESTPEVRCELEHLFTELKNAPLVADPSLFLQQDKTAPQAGKVVYVLTGDPALRAELADALGGISFEMLVIPDMPSLVRLLETRLPAAVVVDIRYLTADPDVTAHLCDIQQQQVSLPICCVAQDGTMMTRLSALRAGASAFFQKPVDVFSLVKMLQEKYEAQFVPLRVLIVDDSLSMAEYYALILQEAAMETQTLTDPLHILETLNEFQPDLVLLDIYMPACSGLEVAGILRQNMQYAGMPVIFLSTETDRLKQLAAISVGGDDFLTKPIAPFHLIAAVRARAERAGFLGSWIMRDSLTGLLNHSSILQHLEMAQARALRNDTGLSFIMLDIDHFKQINDTYGHQAGDRVLRKLAIILLAQLRERGDVAGRYGGEEFAVVLPDTTPDQAEIFCERLRKQFEAIPFEANGNAFHVTFSAGIASGVTSEVAGMADRALYAAKAAGRNQIMVFSP